MRSDRGVGGGYQLAPGASLPPLALDDDEAVAVHLPRADEAPGVGASADRAHDALAVGTHALLVVVTVERQVERREAPRRAASRSLGKSERDPARASGVAQQGHAIRDVSRESRHGHG